MGRKGVSKRKAPKSKTPLVSSTSTTGAVSTIARASEYPTPRSLGNGEAITMVKGNKKKSSNSPQDNKKR